MVSKRRRSPRAALVVCAPRLDRIHDRLFKALGIQEVGDLGRPGGSCMLLPSRDSGDPGRIFALKYLSAEWLSKLDDGKKSPSKEQTTWSRFVEAERSCAEVNQRIDHRWAYGPFRQEISLAKRLMEGILGHFDWDQAAKHFGWGPGASTRLPRRKSDAAYKFSGNPESTIGCAALAQACIKHVPLWERNLLQVDESEGIGYVKIVAGNRIVTVPKNYKTDRTIAIEPDMNMYVQKGIGGLMRRRLKQSGCNLDDQTLNQRLARKGSADGSLATIDLSMASDTVSRAVVSLLVPGGHWFDDSDGWAPRSSWYDALWQTRSTHGVLPSGEKIFYQKFSSMGNGFTFELESAIFLTLARAYVTIHGGEEPSDCVSVYGDDIIMPSTLAPGFCGLLTYLGFTPNVKKSYWSGEFRESCGKHFYAGQEVTPFYVKRAPRTLLDLFKIHNQIWRYEQRSTWMTPEDRDGVKELLGWLRSFAPSRYRRPCLVDGLGDGGFVGFFDEVLPEPCPRGWDGYRFQSIVSLAVEDVAVEHPGILIKSLDNLERSNRTLLLQLIEGEETSMVFPVKGTRYVSGEIFAHLLQLYGDGTPRS